MQQRVCRPTIETYTFNNGLRTVPASVKAVFIGAALLVGVFSTSVVAPLFIFCIMSVLITLKARIPKGLYLKTLTVPLLFTLPVLPAMTFFFGSGEVLFKIVLQGFELNATREGLNLGVLVSSRVLSGSSSLLFLVFTTPMVEIFGAMCRLRFPPFFVELAMMIYRYIFILIEVAERMAFAQEIRLGYSSYRRSYDSFGLLASNLFIRSWERAERAFTGLEVRGYDGKFDLVGYEPRGVPLLPLFAVFLFSVCTALLAYYTKDFTVV
jgi:cobalt/nickel transport system permease protein